jgi:hypothetical protein
MNMLFTIYHSKFLLQLHPIEDSCLSVIFEWFEWIAFFVRNFSLPLLLFGDVRRGRLQQGQIYPS